MSDVFSFHLLATDGAARRGEIATPHGTVATPAFMPVGTQATVKGLLPEAVRATGADILLGNTYHLMLRPGAERVAALGGLHRFMNWPHAILTDSGGFQVMSLSQLRKIDERCVTFRSHLDGALVELSPERAVEIQGLLGSDIAMQLDECLKLPATRGEIERAMTLSLRWAERSKRAFESAAASGRARPVRHRAGWRRSGAASGECARARRYRISRLRHRRTGGRRAAGRDAADDRGGGAALPAERPRYLMGVGTPDDLLAAVARGIDMFDCVLPTRNGRHGLAFTRFGSINLKNARHADDPRPLDAESSCAAARDYSRAYLHHLVKANEMLGAILLSTINLAYYQELMGGIRAAIAAGQFDSFAASVREGWAGGDLAAV